MPPLRAYEEGVGDFFPGRSQGWAEPMLCPAPREYALEMIMWLMVQLTSNL